MLSELLDSLAALDEAALGVVCKIAAGAFLLGVLFGVIVWLTWGHTLRAAMGMIVFVGLVGGVVYFMWAGYQTREPYPTVDQRSVPVTAPETDPPAQEGSETDESPTVKYAGYWWE